MPVACCLFPVARVDLERLFAARGDLIVPPADAQLATLADLAKRFGNR